MDQHLLVSDWIHVVLQINELLYQGLIKFDWNGHQKNRITFPVFPKQFCSEFRTKFGLEELVGERLWLGCGNKTKIDAINTVLNGKRKWVAFLSQSTQIFCYHCGKELSFEFNGTTIRAKGKCRYPNGYPALSGRIKVPSGILVFANYFPFLKEFESNTINSNVISYDLKLWKHYLKLGVLGGYCGNTCPSVRKYKNIIHICTDKSKWKKYGNISTSVWRWEAADLDFVKKFTNKLDKNWILVDIDSGIYKAKNYFHLIGRSNLNDPICIIQKEN